MKTLIISLFTLSVVILFYSINRNHVINEELRKAENDLVMSAFEYGYNCGFNNCKKDSMTYIESSFNNDSIRIAEIIYK